MFTNPLTNVSGIHTLSLILKFN